MAQLDLPVLPPLLFRYRSITDETVKREISAIKEQYLWCSEYRRLNDPMEGFYKPNVSFRNIADSDYMSMAREIFNLKQDIGICCFSDTNENELMWSHYAGNYAGICVAYRPQCLIDGLSEDVHLVRLGYGNAPPDITISDTYAGRLAAIKILSHKKSSWGYEREWRLLGPRGRLEIGGERCVAELYLGSRIARPHKKKILAAFSPISIPIFEMNITDYSHQWSEVAA
jgi:hypothetical protein